MAWEPSLSGPIKPNPGVILRLLREQKSGRNPSRYEVTASWQGLEAKVVLRKFYEAIVQAAKAFLRQG
jgi:hypothetical protein